MLNALLAHAVSAQLAAVAPTRAQERPHYDCPPLGRVYLWLSQEPRLDGKLLGTVWFRGKSYPGYWDGGTLRTFTPNIKTKESPWLSYSRTGMPRVELYLGERSWSPSDHKYVAHGLCKSGN